MAVPPEDLVALKKWLTSLLPEGMSRNVVAQELGVSYKTISMMLNPEHRTLGSGATLLRYLQLVGGLAGAPGPVRPSQLQAISEAVAEQRELLERVLDEIERLDPPQAETGE